jgi:DNA-binding MarR family transcriptional regulator
MEPQVTKRMQHPQDALADMLWEADDVEGADGSATQAARTMYLVKQLEMLLRSRMEPIARSAKLTVPQYTALSILAARPGLSSAELARSTFVSAQAANELVNGLHGRGLILRQPSPEHAKILRLRLSKKGLDLLAHCAAQMQTIEESMLGALGDVEAQGFHDGLRSCIRALQSDGPS